MGHFLYISPFQSTLPVWGGTRAVCETFRAIHDFNPPSPCGEGPGKLAAGGVNGGISIHPPRVGRDSGMLSLMYTSLPFQSTLPVWGGTRQVGPGGQKYRFQSTLPVWGGTGPKMQKTVQKREFQSTLPVWGGTGMPAISLLTTSISIHPPRVGRDLYRQGSDDPGEISIHPPRVGRDTSARVSRSRVPHFNPPSPCGEGHFYGPWLISFRRHFNPPSPCGEGPPLGPSYQPLMVGFQSTLPVWGGTPIIPCNSSGNKRFQSTLPVWGGTSFSSFRRVDFQYFNPPSPCGEGPARRKVELGSHPISIHPPRVGRDGRTIPVGQFTPHFNPPSPCGEGPGTMGLM